MANEAEMPSWVKSIMARLDAINSQIIDRMEGRLEGTEGSLCKKLDNLIEHQSLPNKISVSGHAPHELQGNQTNFFTLVKENNSQLSVNDSLSLSEPNVPLFCDDNVQLEIVDILVDPLSVESIVVSDSTFSYGSHDNQLMCENGDVEQVDQLTKDDPLVIFVADHPSIEGIYDCIGGSLGERKHVLHPCPWIPYPFDLIDHLRCDIDSFQTIFGNDMCALCEHDYVNAKHVLYVIQVKKNVEKGKPVTDEALTPTTEEVKKVDELPAPSPATSHDEEKPQAEESILATLTESKEKTTDTKIEPPTTEEVKKQDKTPALDVTSKDIPKFAREPTPELEAQSIPDQVVDITKSEPEAENIETLNNQSKIEHVDEKFKQKATTIDIVETFETVEKKKKQVHLEASEQQKAKERQKSQKQNLRKKLQNQFPFFFYILWIPHLRPAEYKRSRLPRNRTVNRGFGGVLSGSDVRERFGVVSPRGLLWVQKVFDEWYTVHEIQGCEVEMKRIKENKSAKLNDHTQNEDQLPRSWSEGCNCGNSKGDLRSIHGTMSDNASQIGSFENPLDDEGQLNDFGYSSAICIPLTHGNNIFHVTSIMLHMLQMKGLFGGQSYDDPNLSLKNFVEEKQELKFPNSRMLSRLCFSSKIKALRTETVTKTITETITENVTEIVY
ncbi:hypothetical protein FXO38_25011 [Capsicum annuum]|nr:hypothetical protein FXO38_25011 [Capsicum annuum]